MHLYMPWWGNNKALGFPRGYHIELGGGLRHARLRIRRRHSELSGGRGGGYGAELKDEYRRYYGAFVDFAGRGEQVAREDSYCEIDPNVVDKWGIPVLRFHHTWSDDERLQARHMQETFRSIIAGDGRHADVADADGGTELRPGGRRPDHPRGRRDANGQRSEDVGAQQELPGARREELFVADGGPFVSQADKNLTWTIMALAWRTPNTSPTNAGRATSSLAQDGSSEP